MAKKTIQIRQTITGQHSAQRKKGCSDNPAIGLYSNVSFRLSGKTPLNSPKSVSPGKRPQEK
ncbi:MAG: hypothetical protein M5U34_24755 [Chloroflexi bacterium]|nr:hypothetical protein [Chloroflexota bacterium]